LPGGIADQAGWLMIFNILFGRKLLHTKRNYLSSMPPCLKSFYLLLLLSFSVSVFGQKADSTRQYDTIHLKSYYSQVGVLFKKDYDARLGYQNVKGHFTPSREDAIRAEEIFARDYPTITGKNINVRTFYNSYVRQYVGYIDTAGNRILRILLTDNSKPEKVRRVFGENWERRFTIYASFKRPFEWALINVDLTRGKLVE
jgi:hypothetical protein